MHSTYSDYYCKLSELPSEINVVQYRFIYKRMYIYIYIYIYILSTRQLGPGGRMQHANVTVSMKLENAKTSV